MLLFFISCSAEDKTGGDDNSGGADSVPTFTGDPAADLPNGYYSGTLSYKSHHISDEFIYGEMTKETFIEQMEFTSDKKFCLKIYNNKLKWEEEESLIEKAEEKEALKSGSEYGATIEYKINNEQVSGKERKTIKFTISDDGNTISITYIAGESVNGQVVDSEDEDGNKTYLYVKYSYDATYEGTLNKYK